MALMRAATARHRIVAGRFPLRPHSHGQGDDPARGLVRVTNGLVEPVANGAGQITVETESGEKASIPFEVKNASLEKQVNFSNSIVPLFTKHGCNEGGCHGKSNGQNGFKLSLLGFEPPEDYSIYSARRAGGASSRPRRAQVAFAESQRPVAARRRITD